MTLSTQITGLQRRIAVLEGIPPPPPPKHSYVRLNKGRPFGASVGRGGGGIDGSGGSPIKGERTGGQPKTNGIRRTLRSAVASRASGSAVKPEETSATNGSVTERPKSMKLPPVKPPKDVELEDAGISSSGRRPLKTHLTLDAAIRDSSSTRHKRSSTGNGLPPGSKQTSVHVPPISTTNQPPSASSHPPSPTPSPSTLSPAPGAARRASNNSKRETTKSRDGTPSGNVGVSLKLSKELLAQAHAQAQEENNG